MQVMMVDDAQIRKRKQDVISTDDLSLAILQKPLNYIPKLRWLSGNKQLAVSRGLAQKLFTVDDSSSLLPKLTGSNLNLGDCEKLAGAYMAEPKVLDRLDMPTLHPRLAIALKRHQVEGVNFMWKQVVGFKHGCILAHTMGLGKSLQTIAFLCTVSREIDMGNPVVPDHLKTKRILILAPLTTLDNWISEFYKWLPQDLLQCVGYPYNFADAMSAKKAHPNTPHRHLQYLKHWYNDGGVLLMSYEAYRSLLVKEQPEQHIFKAYLQDPGPSIVVMDEGHRLKNDMSLLSNLVQRIKTPARICLTASPLQNHLDEFYCLVNLVTPGLLPDHEYFNVFYKRPIENIYNDSSKSDLYIAKKQLLKLQLLTSDVVLRRGGEILEADLPEKTEFYLSCRMADTQHEGYKQLVEHFRLSSESVMIGFIALRAICNHPAILRKLLVDRDLRHVLEEDPDVSAEVDEFGQITTDTRDELLQLLDGYYRSIEDVENPRISGKVVIIMGLVDAIKDNNEKAIVVSHSIACLDFLEKLLGARGSGICRIDGNTPQPDRQKIIDVFNNSLDKHVMLLSAVAGSLGVNITGASRIILCDSDWNPVHDEQSIGRIYRYGQTKPVFVYRLTEYSTIEDAIMVRKIHKRGISSRVMDNKYLRKQDKKELTRYFASPKRPEEVVDLEPCNDDPLLKRVAEAEHQSFARVRRQRDVESKDVEVVEENELSEEDVLRVRSEALSGKKAFIIRALHDPNNSNVGEKDILLAACTYDQTE